MTDPRAKKTRAELIDEIRSLEARLSQVDKQVAAGLGRIDELERDLAEDKEIAAAIANDLKTVQRDQLLRRLHPHDLRVLADTLRSLVYLRLESGHHPDDVLMTVQEIVEQWIGVYVDGQFRPHTIPEFEDWGNSHPEFNDSANAEATDISQQLAFERRSVAEWAMRSARLEQALRAIASAQPEVDDDGVASTPNAREIARSGLEAAANKFNSSEWG